MVGGSVKEYCSKIAIQSNESISGRKRESRFGPKYSETVRRRRSLRRRLVTLPEQGNRHRKNTDLRIHPTDLIVFFCTTISTPRMGSALRAHSTRSLSRAGPPCFEGGGLIQCNTYIERSLTALKNLQGYFRVPGTFLPVRSTVTTHDTAGSGHQTLGLT